MNRVIWRWMWCVRWYHKCAAGDRMTIRQANRNYYAQDWKDEPGTPTVTNTRLYSLTVKSDRNIGTCPVLNAVFFFVSWKLQTCPVVHKNMRPAENFVILSPFLYIYSVSLYLFPTHTYRLKKILNLRDTKWKLVIHIYIKWYTFTT